MQKKITKNLNKFVPISASTYLSLRVFSVQLFTSKKSKTKTMLTELTKERKENTVGAFHLCQCTLQFIQNYFKHAKTSCKPSRCERPANLKNGQLKKANEFKDKKNITKHLSNLKGSKEMTSTSVAR